MFVRWSVISEDAEGCKSKAGQSKELTATGELCDSEPRDLLETSEQIPRTWECFGTGDGLREYGGGGKQKQRHSAEGREETKTRKYSRDAILLAVYSSNSPSERQPSADQAVARDEKRKTAVRTQGSKEAKVVTK